MNSEILKSLKKRYSHVHPLIFHRACEKSSTEGELFDIMETIPEKYPIVWDEQSHCWVHTDDLFLSSKFQI